MVPQQLFLQRCRTALYSAYSQEASCHILDAHLTTNRWKGLLQKRQVLAISYLHNSKLSPSFSRGGALRHESQKNNPNASHSNLFQKPLQPLRAISRNDNISATTNPHSHPPFLNSDGNTTIPVATFSWSRPHIHSRTAATTASTAKCKHISTA
jgi:hypothetical protein